MKVREGNEELLIISLLLKNVLRKGFDTRHYHREFKLTRYPSQDIC